jgi:hypothetical protein
MKKLDRDQIQMYKEHQRNQQETIEEASKQKLQKGIWEAIRGRRNEYLGGVAERSR